MTHSTTHAAVVFAALLSLSLGAGGPVAAAAPPEPGTVVTAADVQKVLGGKFTERSPEPGALYYEEEGGGYRQVNVYLWPANGKTVESLKAARIADSEPVDDILGVGDAAMYRPQSNEATVEKKDKDGDVLWLCVSVHNAADAATTKRLAVELAKLGAARL